MRENRTENRAPGAVLDMDRAREAFGGDAEAAEALALTRGLLERLLPALRGPAPDWEALHAIRGCAALLCGSETAERMAEQERRLRTGGLAGEGLADVLCVLDTLRNEIDAVLGSRGG